MPYANVNGTKRSSWIDSKCLNIFHIRSAPAFRHSATASWSCFPVPLREVKEALMGWYLHRRDSTSIKFAKRTQLNNFRLCVSTLNSLPRCWWVWNLHPYGPYVANTYVLQMPCLTHHWCPWMCSITGDTWTASTPAGPKKSRHSNCTSTCGPPPCSAWLRQMMMIDEGRFFRILVWSNILSSIKTLLRRACSFAGQSLMGLRCHQLHLHFEYLIQRHLSLLRMGYTWPESASKLHNSIPTASHRKRYVFVVLPHHHRAPDLQVAGK